MARAANRGNTVTDRPKRVPMNGTVDILEVGRKDPNNTYRWFNDDNKTRITKAKAAWWDNVTQKEVDLALGVQVESDDPEAFVKTKVGTHKDGSPMYAYLMRKPLKYYEEDTKLKQDRIDSQERSQFQTDVNNGQYGEVKVGASRSK